VQYQIWGRYGIGSAWQLLCVRAASASTTAAREPEQQHSTKAGTHPIADAPPERALQPSPDLQQAKTSPIQASASLNRPETAVAARKAVEAREPAAPKMCAPRPLKTRAARRPRSLSVTCSLPTGKRWSHQVAAAIRRAASPCSSRAVWWCRRSLHLWAAWSGGLQPWQRQIEFKQVFYILSEHRSG
jgi:hypothetical protein